MGDLTLGVRGLEMWKHHSHRHDSTKYSSSFMLTFIVCFHATSPSCRTVLFTFSSKLCQKHVWNPASPFEQHFRGLLFNQGFSKRTTKRVSQSSLCTTVPTGAPRDLGTEPCTQQSVQHKSVQARRLAHPPYLCWNESRVCFHEIMLCLSGLSKYFLFSTLRRCF